MLAIMYNATIKTSHKLCKLHVTCQSLFTSQLFSVLVSELYSVTNEDLSVDPLVVYSMP